MYSCWYYWMHMNACTYKWNNTYLQFCRLNVPQWPIDKNKFEFMLHFYWLTGWKSCERWCVACPYCCNKQCVWTSRILSEIIIHGFTSIQWTGMDLVFILYNVCHSIPSILISQSIWRVILLTLHIYTAGKFTESSCLVHWWIWWNASEQCWHAWSWGTNHSECTFL